MRKASAIALVLALGLTASFVVGSAFAGKKPTPVGPLPGAEASARHV